MLGVALLVCLLAGSEAARCFDCYQHGPESSLEHCYYQKTCEKGCMVTDIRGPEGHRLIHQTCAKESPSGETLLCDPAGLLREFQKLHPLSEKPAVRACKTCPSDLCNGLRVDQSGPRDYGWLIFYAVLGFAVTVFVVAVAVLWWFRDRTGA